MTETIKIGHNRLHIKITSLFLIIIEDEIFDIYEEYQETDEENARKTAERLKTKFVNELNLMPC